MTLCDTNDACSHVSRLFLDISRRGTRAYDRSRDSSGYRFRGVTYAGPGGPLKSAALEGHMKSPASLRVAPSRWRSWLDGFASIAMIAAAVLIISSEWRSRAGAPGARVSLPKVPVGIEGAETEGSPTARAIMIEFSDFECPFCGRFARETLPELRTAYVGTGKLRIVFRHLPLPMHQFALGASVGASCAGEQGRFWEMHDALFRSQADLSPESISGRASGLGLDPIVFNRCVRDGAQRRVAVDVAEAKSLGISGTPAFLFGLATDGNRVRVTKMLAGARSVADFQSAIGALLSGSEAANR
jgi:protein-disulfide isomerase